MEKEEILAKSRAENNHRDIYEKEILKQAASVAAVVLLSLATLFFVVQIFTGGGINYGLYALVFTVNMSSYWVKYGKLRKKSDLCLAVVETLFVAALSAAHLYSLVSPS